MATPTYDLLYTITTTTTAPIFITGISQDYRDLVVTYNSANNRFIRLNNNSTGNIYTMVTMEASSNVIRSESRNGEAIGSLYAGGTPINKTWQIMDYSDTTKKTTILERANGDTQYLGAVATIFNTTVAVTEVSFYDNNEIGAVISVYGIGA